MHLYVSLFLTSLELVRYPLVIVLQAGSTIVQLQNIMPVDPRINARLDEFSLMAQYIIMTPLRLNSVSVETFLILVTRSFGLT